MMTEQYNWVLAVSLPTCLHLAGTLYYPTNQYKQLRYKGMQVDTIHCRRFTHRLSLLRISNLPNHCHFFHFILAKHNVQHSRPAQVCRHLAGTLIYCRDTISHASNRHPKHSLHNSCISISFRPSNIIGLRSMGRRRLGRRHREHSDDIRRECYRT